MKHKLKIALILSVTLVAAILLALFLGSEKLSFFDLNESQSAILFDIRLPRVLLGACVGASLAVAGASRYNLCLRNPLAEPYLAGSFKRRGFGDDAGVCVFRKL